MFVCSVDWLVGCVFFAWLFACLLGCMIAGVCACVCVCVCVCSVVCFCVVCWLLVTGWCLPVVVARCWLCVVCCRLCVGRWLSFVVS